MITEGQKVFPVLRLAAQRHDPVIPESVPWSLVAPHEQQARRNHAGQSLEELARRGGLSIQELYYVLQNRTMPPASEWISVGAAATFVTAQIKALQAASADQKEITREELGHYLTALWDNDLCGLVADLILLLGYEVHLSVADAATIRPLAAPTTVETDRGTIRVTPRPEGPPRLVVEKEQQT